MNISKQFKKRKKYRKQNTVAPKLIIVSSAAHNFILIQWGVRNYYSEVPVLIIIIRVVNS